MSNVENNLKKIVKDLSGRLSAFGDIYDDVLKVIDKSSKILSCDLISEYTSSLFGKKGDKEYSRKFNIKKLKKVYKGKSIDSFIINLDEFDRYKKTLIRDSIYVCKNSIIIFSLNKDYDIDTIISRYNRYNSKSTYIECDDGFLIYIDSSNSKNRKHMNKLYYIKDLFYDIIEVISNFIIN